jgi:hypothetical protein
MDSITRILPIITLIVGVSAAEPAFESTYYKDWPLFSTYARETERTQPIEHFGPVGIGIELLLPPFQMKVSRIDKGSPAEVSGKLKVGQMIDSINGQTLKDIDPRIILGGIITKAEATDGIVKFMVKEKPDAKAENPEAGKFQWDGKTQANPSLTGSWTTVAVAPTLEAFNPAKPTDAHRAPFKDITFIEDGQTSHPLRHWTGDTMMDLEKLQALKMTVKDGFLFIEVGGFNERNPLGWKSPVIVMKKAP